MLALQRAMQCGRVCLDAYFNRKEEAYMPTSANWDFLKKPCTWFFDLDDTLAWNCVFYNKPILDFVEFLAEIFNYRVPSPGTIIRLQEDIDCDLGKANNPRTGKPYGFSKHRFPDAFALTYKALCEMGFGAYDDHIAEDCRVIGRRAFDPANYQKLGLVPHAKELLGALKERGDRLVVVTKGDRIAQVEKVEAFGLHEWFDAIHVVDNKDGGVYTDILIDLHKQHIRPHLAIDPEKTIVVGNSFASDIIPALKSGMYGIFIPCPTWKAECMDMSKIDEEERTRVVEVKEMQEIFGMLR